MFQFPGLPLLILWIQKRVTRHYSGGVAPFGYPRILVCNDSPWLFAGYCVLHRLLVPRYPPCALCSLTKLRPLFARLFVWVEESLAPGQVLGRRSPQIIGGIRTSICSFQGTTGIVRPLGWPLRGFFTPGNHQYYQIFFSSTNVFSELCFRL